MPFAIFLDLYRVLADPEEMNRQFRQRMAEILYRDYGVPEDRGLLIHDEAFEWYLREGKKLDAMHNIIGDGDAWEKVVRELDEKHICLVFKTISKDPPQNASKFAKDFEREIVQGTDTIYPDVCEVLKILKDRGHRIIMSTNATSHNGEAALVGAGIRDLFNDVITLDVTKSKKDRQHYWKRAFEVTGIKLTEAVVVDDIVEYLTPAAAMGVKCIQMIRPKFVHLLKRGPFPVIESLTSLPPLLDKL